MSAAPARTGSTAIAWARNQIKSPSRGYRQLCLQFTRLCYGVAASAPDANAGWRNATKRHAATSGANIPAGVPVWWAVGSYGHVAISTGNGKCVSNDILRSGKVDEVSIDYITKRWGARLLGWSEDINGVTVYTAPKPAPTPASPSVSISALRAARNSDPQKSGTPVGSAGAQVKLLEQALIKTGWLGSKHADGHYGTATVRAVQAFQRKHSGSSKPDGWMGKKELTKLFSLAEMTVKVTA